MRTAITNAAVHIENRWKPYPAYKDSGVQWLGEIPRALGFGKDQAF